MRCPLARDRYSAYPWGCRVKKTPPEFLPVMMIDPLRDNFHIIFLYFRWQRENVRESAINSAAVRPSVKLPSFAILRTYRYFASCH